MNPITYLLLLALTKPAEARCVLRPYHLGTEPHRNARGETWGVVERPIDRVEEAVKPW